MVPTFELARFERDFSGNLIPSGGDAMNCKRDSDEQIASALRQAWERDVDRGDLPQAERAEATFYGWKKQFAGTGVVKIRRLKQLEEENAKLKRLVADLSLDGVDAPERAGKCAAATR